MEMRDLTQQRKDHIQSCINNNDNSHEIIAGLYSDPSHFIYEILQNADDAGASEVIFKLTPDSLSITHNGNKLFDFDDVKSITTVGSSTKKDVNSIGTFGAGFKSVFAITKTPHIHSGDFNFKITDFIVPEEIKPANIDQGATHITLPFDHPISHDDAYQQISKRLQALESESLLFLHNIKEVKWKTETDSGHYLSEISGNKASLISQVNEEDSITEYFLFKKDIQVAKTQLNIAVAYLLNSDGVIDPVHDSKLFVFFPTNERTGFKFLVHAPYKTTPSRETIPFDDDQNKIITSELSNLVAESIKLIKNNGLLNVDFLSLLPLDSKNEHQLYRLSFQKVKNTLMINSLLPTSDNGHVNAENALLAREKELTNLLESADCSNLFKKTAWLSTDITYDRTSALRDYLTKELEIPEITMQNFCSKITEKFIKVKPDEWVIKFYSSITNNKALYRACPFYPKGVLRERPIIRLEDNSHINPGNDSGDIQVYLPADGESRFKTVKRILAEDEKAVEFLKNLGLEKPDSIAEIKEFIIPKYKGGSIEFKDYTKDFERVMVIWQQADEYRKKEIVDLLKQSQFVRSVNQNGKVIYQTPDKVYFPTENLSAWFDKNTSDDVFFLDIKLSEQKRKFIESLGVKYILNMQGMSEVRVNIYGWYKRSVHGFNPKFDIHGLEYSLNNITIERSILLWEILLKNTNKLKGYIETKTNQNHPYNKGGLEISEAMNLLNNYAWLYDSEGKLFNIPIDQITLDNLSNEYQKEDENIEKLLETLGLKLDRVAAFEEETGLKAVSNEDYELIQEIKNRQDSEENSWSPETEPDDVTPIVDEADLEERKPKDLSGQTPTGKTRPGGGDNPINPRDLMAIGDWGECVAKNHLIKKYPKYDVICLNEKGSIGKGYDFVIKDNGEEIAYYEIKSKIDESPKLFQISGTQWSWAKELYNDGKGDMYKILLISNAGTEQPTIKEINNPVSLWKSEKLHADPVNIEL